MRIRAHPLALFALLLAAGLPALGQVESWGVAPGVVEVQGAQAGQSYVAKVQLQNQFDSAAQVTVERSGAVGAWTTLDAPDSFTLAARSSREVTLTLAVPGAQGPGRAEGQVTFFREPGSAPGGTGASVRQGAAVILRVDVGGVAVERIAWFAPRAEDAAEGAAVHAYATARNEGNVRTAAVLSGEILPFTGDEVLRNATGRRDLHPGEQGEVRVAFAAGLPVGQYRVHLRADGLDETLTFKVVPPGTTPPDGILKALLHPARATAGQPVRIDAWFENTGTQPIRGAVFKGEARRDGTLLAALESDALAVAPGQSVNLTAYWTPPAAGTYTLVGSVLYDGYLTPESQSLLNVEAGAGSSQSLGWWWLALLALLLVLGTWWWRHLRRKQAK